MDWRKYFDDKIISRGEAYYRKGNVVDFSVDGFTRTATVIGSKDYTVKLAFSAEGDLTDATCDCPYAESGEYCKHMVAVLIAEENNGNVPKQKSSRTSAKKDKKQSIEPFHTEYYYDESKSDLENFKDTIRDIISGYKYRGFIDYENAYDCAMDISAETESVVKQELLIGDYRCAFDCAMFVIRKFSSTDMDDSDGGLGTVCYECTEYIGEAIKDLSTERYAFKKIVSYLKKPNDREWYAGDVLEKFLLENFDSHEYYGPKLDFIDERIEKELERKSDYKVDNLLKTKLSIMHKSGCTDEKINELRIKYWKYASVEKDYIECAISSGNIKEAERILLELIDFQYGLSSKYCREKLLDMYRNSGEKEKYRSILYDFVAEEYNWEMEKYFELKGLCEDSEWSLVIGELLEKIRKNNRQYYPDILLEEGLKEKLLQFVLAERGLYLVQKYEKVLMEDYAEQVLEKYKKELSEQMLVANTRDVYKDIVRTLRKICRLDGGKPIVKSLAEQWRTQYPRRRAMLEELDKLII